MRRAGREDHVGGGDALLAHEPALGVAALEGDGDDTARADGAHELEPGHAATAAYLAASGLDLVAEASHHAGEHVASHVGVRVVEDLRVCPSVDQTFQHQAVIGALGAGGELAVREGPGAAQAKLDVGLGVEDAPLVEGCHHGRASRDVVTPFHQQWGESRARQRKRAEETGAAGAHDDRTVLEGGGRAQGEVGALL